MLRHVVEQLWAPLLVTGDVEIAVNPKPSRQWIDVESYWAIPDARHARILLPRASRRVTGSAASNYRRLRPLRKDVLRFGAALGAAVGVPLSAASVAVRVKDGSEAATMLPLARLSEELGIRPLYSSIGVRTGDNRKATLALIDATGKPAGHAKFGWDEASDDCVANEEMALRELGGHLGPVRTPSVLGSLNYFGHPAFVSSPLPMDVRGGRASVSPVSSQELHHLSPVYRRGPIASSAQFQTTIDHLSSLVKDPVVAHLAARARRVAQGLAAIDGELPICERWHGDFTFWNCARGDDGQLWVWDWESSQTDAIAGLDALHWSFNSHRGRPDFSRHTLAESIHECCHHLVAAGISRNQHSLTAASYASTIAERACSLASHRNGWDSVWISQTHLSRLLDEAEQLTSCSATAERSLKLD